MHHNAFATADALRYMQTANAPAREWTEIVNTEDLTTYPASQYGYRCLTRVLSLPRNCLPACRGQEILHERFQADATSIKILYLCKPAQVCQVHRRVLTI